MTFFTMMGALAAAASGIMAWTARADALRAEKAAKRSEEKATSIAERSVDALNRANLLAEQHYNERRALERRRDRARWAALVRGWVMSRLTRSMLGKRPPNIRAVSIAEVSDARIALDEASAEAIQLWAQSAVKDAVSRMGDEATPNGSWMLVAAQIEIELERWVAHLIVPTTSTSAPDNPA